jgi:hypothetical protein
MSHSLFGLGIDAVESKIHKCKAMEGQRYFTRHQMCPRSGRVVTYFPFSTGNYCL